MASEIINGESGADGLEVVTSTDFTGAHISDMESLNIAAGMSATFAHNTGVGGAWTIGGASGTTETLNINVDGTGGSIDVSGLTFDASWTAGEDVINLTGSGGQDMLKGSAQNETLSGGGANDSLEDGAGDDRVDAGAGDDLVIAGAGADTILGCVGDDTIDYSNSTIGVDVDLKAGTASGGDAAGDVISGIENLTGSDQVDKLTGDDDANRLLGGLGDDIIEGGQGADFLKGEEGDDRFVFNTGDVVSGEQIDGGTANEVYGDRLHVETSTDFRLATSIASIEEVSIADGQKATFSVPDQQSLVLGLSKIIGGASSSAEVLEFLGDDSGITLDLSSASTTFESWGDGKDYTFVQGGSGADEFTAWNSDTYLSGEGDDDILKGGTGNNTLEGGAGGDILDGSAGGFDLASYAGSGAGVTVNLNTGVVSGGDAAGDALTDIEGVIGSDHDDVLTGKAAADNIIRAGACHDKIYMDQNLTSGDTLDGGSGSDTLYFQDAGVSNALDNVTNIETIVLGDASTNLVTTDDLIVSGAILNVDATAIAPSAGNTVFTWIGTSETDSKFNIQGSGGDDSIIGGQKSDTLLGNAGNDIIEGGDGTDSLDGGDGFDWVSYENSTGQVEFTFGGAANDGYGNTDVVANFEGVIGSGQGDILNDDDGVNYFIGGIGDDTIDGKGGTSDWVSYATSTSGVTVDLSAAGYQTTNDGLSGGQDFTCRHRTHHRFRLCGQPDRRCGQECLHGWSWQ